ncbi:conserved hypothetical protein [Hydrogenobacter thermophilus TK-6]|nr:conserved hypothetical protein [Hydrogenobacter thermophilus TK-6]
MMVMSVRHQVRGYVEKLFEGLKEKLHGGEYLVFNVYAKEGNILEMVDVRVDFSDGEAIKKFLDRTTRETLEQEVKGLRLIAMVLEKDGDYVFSSQEEISEELKEEIKEMIEQLKEE